MARESIESGGANAAFEGFRDASKRTMGESVGVRVVEDDGGVAAKNGAVKSWLRSKGSGEGVSENKEKEKEQEGTENEKDE